MSSASDQVSASFLEEVRAKLGGAITPGQAASLELDPEFFKCYDTLATRSSLLTPELEESAVADKLTRELVIISALATRMFRFGVRHHVKQALELGATPKFLAEAVEPLLGASGIPSYFMVMDELGELLAQEQEGGDTPASSGRTPPDQTN